MGFAFLQNLAKNPNNVIFGLARKSGPLEAKLKAEGIQNVHVIEGDVGEFSSVAVPSTLSSDVHIKTDH